MAFDFKYMERSSKSAESNNTEPQIKIFNLSKTAQASYIFLNKKAIELLNLKENQKIRVGIDTTTHKIVIIPCDNDSGRKITKNLTGSGTISIAKLIDENNIPTQLCRPAYNRNYALGGLIFTYEV
jgi:hypothetical protein